MNKKKKIVIGVCVATLAAGTVGATLAIKYLKKDKPGESSSIVVEEGQSIPFSPNIESDDDFIYNQADDGTLAITGASKITSNLVLPRSYQGAIITTVAPGAFQNNTEIRSVTIGYPVMIEFDAFRNSSLTDITIKDDNGIISDTVVGFSPYCFAECKDLKNFYCEAYIPDIEPYMFADCTSLESVVFITPAYEIPDYTFKNCSSLTEIELPGTIQYVAETAFEGCDNLRIIRGFNGSYLETWAKDNGYSWEGIDILGD